MKNIGLTLLFILWSNIFIAQTGDPNTDALLDSARQYIYSDKIKCYKFTAELKQKAVATNNKTALAYAYHFFGVIDENHGDNEAAFKNYSAALEYAEQSKDTIARLRILTALSNYYLNLSQTAKCIEICHQGIKEATAIGNNEMVSKFYNNLSIAHSHIREYEKSLMYIDTSIQLKKELNNKSILANAYLHKGLLLNEMKNYEEGFKYYALAEELYLEYNTYHALTQTHINFAWDYTDLKKYKKAREHLGKALFFGEKSDDKIRQAGVWNAFGYYYKNIGYTDSVTYALEKGLQLSLEAENKRNALVAYQELASHYQDIGNSKLALENLKKAYNLKDSIFEESKIQLAQSLNVRYETEQKEEQIKLLGIQKENDRLLIQKQRLTLIILLLSGVVVLILSSFLFIRYKKKQEVKKQEELQNQKEVERIRIARDMHDEIGAGLTRIVIGSEQVKRQLQSGKEIKNGIVESLEKMAIESRELSHNIGEIIWALNPKNDTLDNLFAYIRNYAYDFLEEAEITCNISFPENIPATSVSPELRRNIFLIVKESLNNIVKHASASKVTITLKLSENYFSMIIQDNGKGIVENNELQSNGNGLGNMKKRTEESGGVFSTKNENGFLICIENVPFKNPTKV